MFQNQVVGESNLEVLVMCKFPLVVDNVKLQDILISIASNFLVVSQKVKSAQ